MSQPKSILFNGWELQFLQQTLNRWYDYKGKGAYGGGTFSDAEQAIVKSIRPKVQVVEGTLVSFTPKENNFLQTVLYAGRQDYGRGSGNSVFESTRTQVQQRTVQLTLNILEKLRGSIPTLINPGETEALES